MNIRNGAGAAPLMSERRVSLLGAILVAIGPISMALYTPAMPEIVRAFGTTEAAVKMTLSLYFAGFAVAQLVCGPLSDGLGRKPVTFAFMGIYAVASLVAVLAPTVEVLIAARFFQGVGAAAGVAISRALVRDLFTNEQSARIMNLTGLILAAGPALAPTIGGLTMELAGWQAIFLIMLTAGFAIVIVVQIFMHETVEPDPSRIRPGSLLRSYGTLLATPYFVTSGLIVAGSVGALYTQATILPFILMDDVGLTPSQFGVGMLMQTGLFFAGSLSVRFLMRRTSAWRLVPVGLSFIAAGSLLVPLLLNTAPLSFLSVMGPVGVYAYGIAFVMPAMLTASLAPFPRIAGSASSLGGFMQMGAGLLGGSVAALIGEPVLAMSTVVPAMGATAILSWLLWRRMPEPAHASPVRTIPDA
ncbi:multidrug effflux MFS transporter [Chelativorans sp. SCAU2101]|jgi:drug resistance transporter, Bcr/CflA subfamily|uniref:Bcr/CflA family efflux transporter n=1 Tax=Chelativorans petroleitrophicus TaxID=2975484 RepID=A0A9X2X5B1_9HYPH|nr:multidrug effflux MFS transporter [Chelativorans petroleitrophicus]MCT8988773.1 multidrug effflux MFS transporter [Chelativorans petroleitrophicus]